MAWDHAIVARVLLDASYESFVPRTLRHRARLRYVEILKGLVEMAARTPTGALIWADPYNYGASANNQWASVWALLPSIVDPLTPKRLQTSLRQTVRTLLLAQDAATPNPGIGLASQVDRAGQGKGFHVFGTAIAALSWNFLAANQCDAVDEIDFYHEYARKATDRLVRACPRLLDQPSYFDAQEPLSLEGYFAWAGLLLAVASAGIILTERDVLRVLHTVSAFERVDVGLSDEALLVDQYKHCCNHEGLFDEDMNEIVARSASRIALLYKEVPSIGNAYPVTDPGSIENGRRKG